MKKFPFIVAGILVLLTVVLEVIPKSDVKKDIAKESIPEGMTNAIKRQQWEIKRLADPETGEIPAGIRRGELEHAQKLPVADELSRDQYGWTAMGPFNVGGRTRAAAFDVRNENIIIAGSISGGIWKTINGGTTWSKVSTPDQNVGASCLTQDTRAGKEDTWYMGTGERYNSAKGGNALFLGTGIWKSTDNGETWDTLSVTSDETPEAYQDWDKIWAIVTSPEDTADIVYASTPTSIYKSWDGGETWTRVMESVGAGAYSYSNIMITPSGVLYATFSNDGNKKGIWRSEDGDNWTQIKPTGWPGSYNRIVSGFDPSDENIVYFIANTPNSGLQTFNFRGDSEWNSFWKYEYLSGDGSGAGGTWEDRSLNLPIGPYQFDDFNCQGSYDLLVQVKPNDPNTVIIGGTNLYRSTDAFATPNNTTHIGGYEEKTELPDFQVYPTHHPDQHIVFFSESNPDVMYSGNDGGLFRTDDITADSIVWNSLNNGYLTTQFYTNAIDHGTEGSNVIIGGLQDNGTQFTNSSDPNADWHMSLSYDGAYCAIEDGAGSYYMSIQSGRILKLEVDNDGVMTASRRIDPIGGGNYDFINPFALEPVENEVLYVSAGNKLWRNDSIKHIQLTGAWDSISQGWMQLSGTTSGTISAFGPTHSGSMDLYIGTSGGKVYLLDSAVTGNPTFTDVGSVGGYVSSISVDPRDDKKVMVVVSNYNAHSVHYTNDGGQNWWRISGNMEGDTYPAGLPQLYSKGPYPSCRWGQIIPFGNETVYLLATSVGLFATNQIALGTDIDSDTTVWVRQGASTIGNAVCNMIDYRASDGFTAIATHGDGMFTSYLTNPWGVTAIKEESKIDKLSIYPNPASDWIIVNGNNNQLISIYSINGQLIQTTKQNRIDISNIAPGSYIVVTGNQSKRFVKY